MKRRIYLRTLLLLVCTSLAFTASAKDPVTAIKDIDVDKHLDQYITVEGLVTQYTPSTPNTTAYYILKGEFGRPIQINTSNKQPIINRKYTVKGIVKADIMTDQPYLVEQSRGMVIPVWIFIAIGGVGMLILVVVLLLTIGSKNKNDQTSNQGANSGPAPGNAASSRQAPDPNNDPAYDYDKEYKTVQVVTGSGLTLVAIEGKFKIIGGEDEGKLLELMGKPNGIGGVVTIGSIEKQGEDRASHFRIVDRTVSRQQAELLWDTHKERLLLKNLGKVNYTKINGEEIMVEETKELKYGDKIKFGNREFEFVN